MATALHPPATARTSYRTLTRWMMRAEGQRTAPLYQYVYDS